MDSTTSDFSAIVNAIGRVVGPDRPIQLHEPRFSGNEAAYLKECLDTTMVSSVGPFVDRFERDLAAFTGAARAVVVVNGTAALHLALVLVGVKPGDEVLIPTLTFVATANAVAHEHAIPHLVDSEATTLGLDVEKLGSWLAEIAAPGPEGCVNRRTGRRIAALVPMHTFGFAVDVEPLCALAARYGIPVVEDAAESLGTTYRGRHTGIFGRIGALSFNGNKVITTGGGGALITMDEALGARAKHLSTTARVRHAWLFVHDEVGYNYRMPNLNAALGVAQLEGLPERLAAKRRLALAYRRSFEGVDGAKMVVPQPHTEWNAWLNTLRLGPGLAPLRDALLDRLAAEGLNCRPVWRLMHRLPMYASCPRMDLSGAEALEQSLVNLPSSHFLAPGPGEV